MWERFRERKKSRRRKKEEEGNQEKGEHEGKNDRGKKEKGTRVEKKAREQTIQTISSLELGKTWILCRVKRANVRFGRVGKGALKISFTNVWCVFGFISEYYFWSVWGFLFCFVCCHFKVD